ncbi:MAG: hypothetical protein JWN56_276 [Sphingobacteriales bacterium]|nr:hypothetical protein [Sphingobacteriales bacterium]
MRSIDQLLFIFRNHLLIKQLLHSFDLVYFLKFSFLLIILFYFHIAFNGIISPEGSYYSPFLDLYLNYIAGFRFLILTGSKFILYVLGINSYIENAQIIRIAQGPGVNIWLPCLGLGIISFWLAFVIAHKGKWQRKLLWCAFGIMAISTINCIRIVMLLIAMNNHWEESSMFDHHDFFNLSSYILIYFLVHFYHKTEYISG